MSLELHRRIYMAVLRNICRNARSRTSRLFLPQRDRGLDISSREKLLELRTDMDNFFLRTADGPGRLPAGVVRADEVSVQEHSLPMRDGWHVHARSFYPLTGTSKPSVAMLYIHGGGFCLGSVKGCACAFSRELHSLVRFAGTRMCALRWRSI